MDELRMKEENPMSEKAKREKMWYEFFQPKKEPIAQRPCAKTEKGT